MTTGRPNVLLITTDHWPGALLGSSSHPAIKTPTLDRLADEGVRFSRAYSESPVCIPARRTLMTGTSPRGHGDRSFDPAREMPDLPLLAESFSDAGYQTFAVGKLHVFPQRNRIGFDDVMLAEEGRSNLGSTDDYEIFLADQGHPGQQFAHAMSNNDYVHRPWHLPEHLHPTNWAAEQMSRSIRRRDPTRPGLWYLSFQHPHPPLAPLQHYFDAYRDIDVPLPVSGSWAADPAALPPAIRAGAARRAIGDDREVRSVLRAFYALCTHIDHQIRRVLGTLREEGILDDTVIAFTSDHGDMLGNHGLWAKRTFYENSTRVPLIMLGPANNPRFGLDALDTRLVGLQDIMPTLLDIADIPIPATVEGNSLITDTRREYLYGEFGEDGSATRMITDDRYKLIYYPSGNRVQLFDLIEDPDELTDLSSDGDSQDVRDRLVALLLSEMYGSDLDWMSNGHLIGFEDQPAVLSTNRDMFGVRGAHWPPPPLETDPGKVVGG